MDELFNILSSSARFDKSNRKGKRSRRQQQQQDDEEEAVTSRKRAHDNDDNDDDEDDDEHQSHGSDDHFSQNEEEGRMASRDRTGKRDMSDAKRKQIHKEEIAAFRRSMVIRVANKHDPDLPDPIAAFQDIQSPSWWQEHQHQQEHQPQQDGAESIFQGVRRATQRNIELGKWKEPTPIQMQSIPGLLERRDVIGAAPTGSGKSGAFIIPALFLSSAPHNVYYNTQQQEQDQDQQQQSSKKKKKKSKKAKASTKNEQSKSGREGEIRVLILAPARELATQLHREVERLGIGKVGGISAHLLSKSNVSHIISGTAGGKNGIDVLVATPLRLVDAIEKGLRLDSARMVVLDEADRLLDAADGKTHALINGGNNNSNNSSSNNNKGSDDKKDNGGDSDSDSNTNDSDNNSGGNSDSDGNSNNDNDKQRTSATLYKSGSSQSHSFLAQMDVILHAVPATAVRALFSATVTSTVKSLAESILRNPIDLKIAAPGSYGGANTSIDQKLMFVGREDGKLLAMRQIVQRGELKPPAIVFVQSKERAQALFSELLYDGIHVDVIHAGRSKTARDTAVARFRKGETWVLICTDLVARGVDFRAVRMVINYDLPTSGITYVHRIGRTGRAGRSGRAITMFTEADFENLRTIANVMKQSGCEVEDWMLQLKKSGSNNKKAPPIKRSTIDTTPRFDKQNRKGKRRKR